MSWFLRGRVFTAAALVVTVGLPGVVGASERRDASGVADTASVGVDAARAAPVPARSANNAANVADAPWRATALAVEAAQSFHPGLACRGRSPPSLRR